MTGTLASEQQIQSAGLSYRYRVGATPNSPLVLLVHGRGGNNKVMWSFNRAVPSDFHIFSPEAPISDPDIGGFSWWLVNDQENRDTRIESSVLSLVSFYSAIVKDHNLSPEVTVLCGFSQGGALLSEVVQRNAIPCDGLGLLSSFVLPKEFRSDLPEVFIAHGSQDNIIPLSKIIQGKELLEKAGAEVFMVQDETGHKLGVNGLRQLKEWLNSYS